MIVINNALKIQVSSIRELNMLVMESKENAEKLEKDFMSRIKLLESDKQNEMQKETKRFNDVLTQINAELTKEKSKAERGLNEIIKIESQILNLGYRRFIVKKANEIKIDVKKLRGMRHQDADNYAKKIDRFFIPNFINRLLVDLGFSWKTGLYSSMREVVLEAKLCCEKFIRESDLKHSNLVAVEKKRHQSNMIYIQKNISVKKEEIEKSVQANAGYLYNKYKDKFLEINKKLQQYDKQISKISPVWRDQFWKNYKKSQYPPKIFRVGNLYSDLSKYSSSNKLFEKILTSFSHNLRTDLGFSMPCCLSFNDNYSLLIKANNASKVKAMEGIQSIVLRLLATVPPGKLLLSLVDPIGIGASFRPFLKLTEYDEKLTGGRVWTRSDEIEEQLGKVTRHMEDVIQKYLQNQFKSIEDYNQQAGENAEPYRLLVIMDFPHCFTDEATRKLISILANGHRCGVHTILHYDEREKLPYGFDIREFERLCNVIYSEKEKFYVIRDNKDIISLNFDSQPSKDVVDIIVKTVGVNSKENSRVELPFERIALKYDDWWSFESKDNLVIPIGKSGANKIQQLKLGVDSEHHCLIGGLTGSGKSSLLHAIIINGIIKYSPEELQLYLMDFKKGVGFKIYANYKVPHARVIAIDSEREFAYSVLIGLDQEMTRRGELFKSVVADSISTFRNKSGQKLPRILIIIDEFHEIFSEDDHIERACGLILERIAKQGRALGVHLILSSQTASFSNIGRRDILSQVAVRIAFMCSEEDSARILDEKNLAAADLSRQGQAIYNSQSGKLRGNTPFQVVFIKEKQQNLLLANLSELNLRKNSFPPQLTVFEGDKLADIEVEKSHPINRIAVEKKLIFETTSIWLGEPVTLDDPVKIEFYRQASNNVLIVGNNHKTSKALFVMSIISLITQISIREMTMQKQSLIYIFDYSLNTEENDLDYFEKSSSYFPEMIRVEKKKAPIKQIFNRLVDELDKRVESYSDKNSPSIYLLIFGLQRARDLRISENESIFSFEENNQPESPDTNKHLVKLVQDGPEYGIHTIIWCDTLTNLSRYFNGSTRNNDFGTRILFPMGADDLSILTDNINTIKLKETTALLFDCLTLSYKKFRPYKLPSLTWIERIFSQLKKLN